MILYRYIVREHILPFCYSFVTIVFLLIMQLAVQLLERIISKGLEPAVVLELFMIQMGWIIALATPMAILVATLIAFGRMSADSEIVAIKASGRNLYFLITPVFISSLVLAVLLIFFNNLILPDANHRAANLASDISRKKPAAFIEPGVLIRDFKNYVLYVNEAHPRSGLLRGVKIFSDVPGQDPSTTVADSGRVRMTADGQYLQLTLFHGETHSINSSNSAEHFLGRFEKQVIFIHNVDSELRRSESRYRGDREKSSQVMLKEVAAFRKNRGASMDEFSAVIDSVKSAIVALDEQLAGGPVAAAEGGETEDSIESFDRWASSLRPARASAVSNIRKQEQLAARLARRIRMQDTKISQYLVEVHKKYSIPVTCMVFVLVGAPLGIMARHGGLAVGVSYSIFFFILFWAFLIGGESLADRLIVSPAVAMWSGNVVVAACGILLIVRMVRETAFISLEPLRKLWQRLLGRRRRRWHVPTIFESVLAVFRAVADFPFFVARKVVGILPIYLVKTFLGYLGGVLAAIVVIFVVVDCISNLKRFEGSSFVTVALYYWYYLPWLVLIVLPIVLLLASMFSIGSFAKHSELTAMKGAGISLHQLTMPLLFLGVCLSVASFYFGEEVFPRANQKRKELAEDMKEGRIRARSGSGRTHREFRRNFYYFGNAHTIYCFQEFRTHPQKTKNVWRESFDGNRIVQRVQARSLDYRDNVWYFIDGSVRNFTSNSSTVIRFDTLADTVLTSPPDDMVVRIKGKEEMSYRELKNYIEKVKRQGEKVSKYMADLYFKIALPAMNCVVILLGISVTAKMGNRGGGVLFGVGLLMTFSYWIIARFALAFAQNGQIPPLTGAWFGNIVFLALGLFLYGNAKR